MHFHLYNFFENEQILIYGDKSSDLQSFTNYTAVFV